MTKEPEKPIRVSFDQMVDRRTITRAPDGGLQATRDRKPRGAGGQWLEAVLAEYDHWRDVVGLPTARQIDVEVQVRPPGTSPTIAFRVGLPRVDAIIHHVDGVTLVEAKVDTSVSSVMAGVGQLLYYSMLAEDILQLRVKHLLLAVPNCPPLLIAALDRFKLPVRVLKVTEDKFFGCLAATETSPHGQPQTDQIETEG